MSANEKGTWFIGEMHHGVGFPAGFMQDGIGYSARGVFGVGGRISGTFLLCHALFSLGYGGFLETTATPIDSGQLERSIIDVGGGFRLSIPIVGRVRVYTDILAGYGHILTDLSLGPYERYDMSYGGFALTVGGGLQYRLARFMSIGVRGEWTGVLRNELVDFATAVLARPQSDSAFHGRHAYFVSATFHF
ncbi:MAG: hypothetical protein HUU55_03980 [Myxococcales bacterium]|nr:hypothetical protein [Myxococcales bacterium]